MQLYEQLADWYPLFSPAENFVIEAELYRYLYALHGVANGTLLDLGAGGGNVASHLSTLYHTTLVDRSAPMLANAQRLNPTSEAVLGDLCTLRLDRTFDAVLLHDAIMYLVTEAEVEAALTTVAAHLRPGGIGLLVPDFTRETFAPGESYGGRDTSDGKRGLRYLQWVRDPDPRDTQVTVDLALMLRRGDDVVVVADRHYHALFEREVYRRAARQAGLEVIDGPGQAAALVVRRPLAI